MNNIIYFVNTGFSRGIDQPLDWWEYRLKIFKYFTLQSLMNQSDKEFYLRILLRRNYPLRDQLEDTVKESKLNHVFIYDDIPNDLENVLKTIPEFEKVEYVSDTRIDSDDLFHKDVINEIKQYEFQWKRALVFQKGYCYDCKNDRLQHYKVSSPPNATIMFPKEIYLDSKKRSEYMTATSHDQVFRQMNSIVLSENKYLILIHEKNLDSGYYDMAERPNILENHDEILKDFGINCQTYEQIWKE